MTSRIPPNTKALAFPLPIPPAIEGSGPDGPRMPNLNILTGYAQQVGTMNCSGYLNYIDNGGNLSVYTFGPNNTKLFDATNMCLALYYNERKTPIGGIRVSSPTLYTLWNDDGNPDIRDVTQLAIGSCVFESIICSMVYKDKDFIKNAIQPVFGFVNQFFVRLYDKNSAECYVRITTELPQRAALNYGIYRQYRTSTSGKPIIWPDLLSKAYVSIANYFPDFLSFFSPRRSGYNFLDGADPENFKQALVALTGKLMSSYRNDSSWISNKPLFNSKSCISIAVLKPDLNLSLLPTTMRYVRVSVPSDRMFIYLSNRLAHVLIHAHAYSVFGIFSRSNSDVVVFRNPWGNATLVDNGSAGSRQSVTYSNGIGDMPLSLFSKLFNVHYIT